MYIYNKDICRFVFVDGAAEAEPPERPKREKKKMTEPPDPPKDGAAEAEPPGLQEQSEQ